MGNTGRWIQCRRNCISKGTADVFGEKCRFLHLFEFRLEYSVGDNIAKEAMTLKQDIPQEMQSDDLGAVMETRQ